MILFFLYFLFWTSFLIILFLKIKLMIFCPEWVALTYLLSFEGGKSFGNCSFKSKILSSSGPEPWLRYATRENHPLSVKIPIFFVETLSFYPVKCCMIFTTFINSIQWLTLTTLNYFCINHGEKRFFQFEIIINGLVSFFRFICIHMLWVHDHYKYFNSSSAWTVRIWRLHTSDSV